MKVEVRVDDVNINRAVGCYADSRDCLLDHIDQMSIESVSGAPFLEITMPCGTRTYQTREDVPFTSQRCLCDVVPYEHWFILYAGDDL